MIERDERLQVRPAERAEDRAIVLDLALVGERVELLEHVQGEAAARVDGGG